MSLRKQQSIFATNVARLILHARTLGYEVTLGEAWRPEAMAKIYSGKFGLIERATKAVEWFVKRGIRKSAHTNKLAIDLNLFKDGKYLSRTEDHKELGELWESLHEDNRWGGRFNDGNHYEMRRP